MVAGGAAAGQRRHQQRDWARRSRRAGSGRTGKAWHTFSEMLRMRAGYKGCKVKCTNPPPPLRLPRADPRQSVPRGGAVDGAAGRCRAGRRGLLAAGAGRALPRFRWRCGRAAAGPFRGWALIARRSPLGGLFFAADLAAWHEGILSTKLANATLFGNFASFLFAIYGFILLRRLPRPDAGSGAAARRGRHRSCCSAAATSSRPTISPATCSPCSPASSTPST